MAVQVTLPAAGQAALRRAQRRAGMTKQAWRAQRKLTAMLPMLERYARAVLRDPRVHVSATRQASYTDGKNIYIQPPMMLGDDLVHQGGACGVRGEDKRLICPACDGDEIVMSLLYHEISHMAFGSLTPPEKLGRSAIGRLVAEWHPPQACDHGIEVLEAMAQCENYMAMASCFDERLYPVANALEDARVNAGMLKARPGTKAMLDARTHYVFRNDVEQIDGTKIPWPELPVDAQVVLGMLLGASGYREHFEVFHREAQAILDDEVLVDLAAKIGGCKDVHELMVHTADVWRRFQELGILLKDKCVPPPPEPEDEDEPDKGDEPDTPEEDSGDDKDMGSLGNEGQPSPSDGDGEGGGKDEDKNDGDSSADSDPTAGGGAGSSPGPSSSGTQGKDSGSDRESGNDDETDSGGGDRLQDKRGTGDQDDDATEGEPGGDSHDESGDADGGDAGRDESDDGKESPGGGLADGEAEATEATGEESQDAGDEGTDGEPSSTQPEGGASSDEDGPGEDAGTDGGPGGGDQGGEDGDGAEGSEEDLRPGGPDEDDESEPADFTPATLEQLTRAIQAGSLHAMFDDESTDNFASGHSLLNEHPIDAHEAEQWAAALLIAGLQSMWFEGPSEEVGKVQIVQYGDDGGVTGFNKWNVSRTDLAPPLSVVGPVVTRGRIAFSPNKRTSYETGLKSGKINGRSLRKIPLGDERIFRKKNVARKRSYHVIITMDVSGSTDSEAPSDAYPDQTTLQMMCRSVFAQAEALNRLGISFEIWAHTAHYFLDREESNKYFSQPGAYDRFPPMDVWLLQVKTASDKWDDAAKQRMHSLKPLGGNLDGHTLQVMRKKADELSRKFTDVIICYYTDGAMPASNYREEGAILKSETDLCRRKGYHLLAVAAGTDSPAEWGFDTVRIDSDTDLPKVMAQLERTIM